MKNVVSVLFALFCAASFPLVALPGAAEWTYREVVTNPGTRSEGRIGYLHYGDESVQGYFNEIVIDGKRYLWHVRINLWDTAGYILDGSAAGADPAVHEPPANPETIERGWYAASYGDRRTGTPERWVWVRRDGLSGYVDPSLIRIIADRLKIEPAELDGLHLEQLRPAIR